MAAPRARGTVPATIGTEPRKPTDWSKRCIEPPMPLQRPDDLPNISEKNLYVIFFYYQSVKELVELRQVYN